MRLFLSQTDSPPFQASVSPCRAELGIRFAVQHFQVWLQGQLLRCVMFTFPGQESEVLAPRHLLLHQHGSLRHLRVRLDQSLALWSLIE